MEADGRRRMESPTALDDVLARLWWTSLEVMPGSAGGKVGMACNMDAFRPLIASAASTMLRPWSAGKDLEAHAPTAMPAWQSCLLTLTH